MCVDEANYEQIYSEVCYKDAAMMFCDVSSIFSRESRFDTDLAFKERTEDFYTQDNKREYSSTKQLLSRPVL